MTDAAAEPTDQDSAGFDFDFEKLPQPARAFALVGFYFWNFAMLEDKITEVISEVLGLNLLQGAIIGRNLEFSDKVGTLRSLVWAGVADPKLRSRYDGAFKSIVDRHAANRNIVAHSTFADEGNGVKFSAVKARKQLEIKDVVWSVEMFFAEFEDMKRLWDELDHLRGTVSLDRIKAQLLQGRLGGLGGFMAIARPAGAEADGYPGLLKELLGEAAGAPVEKQAIDGE